MDALTLVQPWLTAYHMGNLHPFEQALVLLLAFGPFLVLFGVVFVVRRRDVADDEASAEDASSTGEDVSRAGPPAS